MTSAARAIANSTWETAVGQVRRLTVHGCYWFVSRATCRVKRLYDGQHGLFLFRILFTSVQTECRTTPSRHWSLLENVRSGFSTRTLYFPLFRFDPKSNTTQSGDYIDLLMITRKTIFLKPLPPLLLWKIRICRYGQKEDGVNLLHLKHIKTNGEKTPKP